MLENSAMRLGKQAVVTKATCRDSITTSIASSCWLYADGKYEDSEYSADEEVLETYKLLATKPEFFGEFLNIAKKYRYEQLLVPAIKGAHQNIFDAF